jgi:uncharacterized protein YcfJ
MKKIIVSSLLLATTILNAEQSSFVEYVRVSHSNPSYENVITKVPHKECYDQRVPVTSYNNSYTHDDTGSAILGGIVGGILGHQIGGGRGKDLATAGGAILGTFVGQNAARANAHQYQSVSSYETKRRCSTRYSERRERKFMGYKNVAYYKGHKIVKYSDNPLSTIPVTITISY